MVIIENYMINEMHLSGAKLLVYAALCGHVENGYSTITQDQLAEELGLGLRTVNRFINELDAEKRISVKPFRDNGKKRNAIMLNDIHIQMKQNSEFNEILEFWNDKISLNEVMSIDIYKKLQKKQYSSDVIKDAIERYSMILNDKLYYKSHVYKFSSFLNKLEDYFKNGIEWREYCVEYNKRNATSFTASDRAVDPLEESKKYNTDIPMEDFDEMEI